jgi:hypothetical protein
VVTTEHVSLQAGGTVRLMNTIGDLGVEAWDEPGVEITVIRTTFRHDTPREQERAKHDLERIRVTATQLGNNAVEVDTRQPSRSRIVRAFPGVSDFNVYYRVKVPRDARLVIRHGVGAVTVNGVAGGIDARARIGDIIVQLPGSEEYAVDAKCRIGVVRSDLPGNDRNVGPAGHRPPEEPGSAAHPVSLRAGVGSITIQRM